MSAENTNDGNNKKKGSALDVLEENIELIEEEPQSPYAPGSIITSDAGNEYRIDKFVHWSKGVITYRALQKNGESEKAVWLKISLNMEGEACLIREAQILSDLNLPMFLKIYEQFKESERYFLAEECGDGTMLAEYFNNGELTLSRLLSILAQIAYGLEQLHERGWIHLGIQPLSILAGKPAKLIDTRWVIPRASKTPSRFYYAGYSAPELLQDQTIDERADIYSIGAVLYHAIMGKSIPESGLADVEFRHLTHLGGIPQVLWKCLTDYDNRYASMKEVHDELMKLVRLYSPTFSYRVYGASTIGLEPMRTTNQDCYFYVTGRVDTEVGPYNWGVIAIADGMGGLESGDVASNAAIAALMEKSTLITQSFYPISPETQTRLIANWVQDANEKVNKSLVSADSIGGTTLSSCLLIENRLAIAHVGDCRIYLFRQGKLELLTRDHSLAMSLALQGKIPLSEVRNHPDRNQITRSLGGNTVLPDLLIDTLEVIRNKPTMDLVSDDLLILCSDGIWESITEPEMLEIIAKEQDSIDTMVRRFIASVLQKGAPDNATIIIFRISQETPEDADMIIGKKA
jgi:PPM family protein phosphatase